jgi:LysR family transcriptional regulator (chromosome initiation inhibitor)
MLVQDHIARNEMVNLCPGVVVSVPLYWHCWNLHSAVIDRLTAALQKGAQQFLVQS